MTVEVRPLALDSLCLVGGYSSPLQENAGMNARRSIPFGLRQFSATLQSL